jgi:hypothetical protein
MIRPFKPAPGNFKFVFVLIDKFSKWIEYKPLVKASSKKAVEFLDQVIHRFGIPNNIITDLRYVLRIHFLASNNAAEYEACFHGLPIAVDLGIKLLYVHGDSALVINQLNKDWDTTSEKMDAYCKEIRKLEGKF